MSGANLAQEAQDAAARPATSVPSEDPAALLRAAALMTLKSKRRRPTIVKTEPVPPRSFVAPPSIELDYGQEEPAGTSSIASSPAVAPAKPTIPPPSHLGGTDADEGAAKEEGEISESELAPPTPPAKVEPQSPVLKQSDSAVVLPPPEPRERSAPPVPSTSSAPDPLPLLPHETFVPPVAPMVVDESHARPGLNMTQAQYDAAKDIVLDLLGWGVPPEYLVNCGLSREIVYYVFVELNLRLPSNLDTTGLPPIPVPPSTSPPSAAPVPPSNPPRLSLSHPSLPPKPQPHTEVTPVETGASRGLSASATPFFPAGVETPVSAPSSSGTNLHDMEQQRRQELLARKAVLASRKSKRKAGTFDPPARPPPKADNRSAAKEARTVPTDVVDDFLQSIEQVVPVSNNSDTSAAATVPTSTTTTTPHGLYDIDLDDVPGLTTSNGLVTEYTPLPRPPPAGSGSLSISTTSRSPAPQSAVSSASERSFRPPPSATHNPAPTLSYDGDDDDMDAIPGLFQSRAAREDDKPSNARRGVKRPVAADFVDMEPGPSKARAKGDAEFTRANVRRRIAGFAGLPQRRCIIDLSDSEEDEREPAKPVPPTRADSRASKPVTPQVTAVQTPRHHSPVVAPAIAPSILQEKEEAIRKMRELIAQREETRKKKLAASSRSTPTSSVTPTNGVVTVKQEDDESVGVRSFDPSRSTSSATPDPMSNSRPYDSQDERSVLATLLPHGMRCIVARCLRQTLNTLQNRDRTALSRYLNRVRTAVRRPRSVLFPFNLHVYWA
ncbi:hypothetical protein C8Q77DRAFT_1060166 [Trametes polyzona]|nr:hypothetical protein C8Q77DRAFT_1060166 [Trametes polyzona]